MHHQPGERIPLDAKASHHGLVSSCIGECTGAAAYAESQCAASHHRTTRATYEIKPCSRSQDKLSVEPLAGLGHHRLFRKIRLLVFNMVSLLGETAGALTQVKRVLCLLQLHSSAGTRANRNYARPSLILTSNPCARRLPRDIGPPDSLSVLSAPAGVLSSVGQLIERRPSDVEQHPANHGEEECGDDAHAVVTCTAPASSAHPRPHVTRNTPDGRAFCAGKHCTAAYVYSSYYLWVVVLFQAHRLL